MKNRTRENCTSGSVRDEAGQPPHLLGRRTFLRLHPGPCLTASAPAPGRANPTRLGVVSLTVHQRFYNRSILKYNDNSFNL